MQPWTGDRRRERSSSVVLLKGKLSAIVRRGSIFQAEPEEGRGSNSSHSYSKEEGEEADESDGRHSNSSSTVSTMTMWDPSASRNAQRFQFYPTRSLVAAALARPLGEDEVARRVSLEAKINSFETIHMNFAPMEVSDKQEGKKEEEMDNNEIETLEEEERRAALEDDEDEESADDEESEGFGGDEECLDFDSQNMPASVRTLMNRIKSESLLGGSGVHVGSAAGSNQDDDDDDDDEEDDGEAEDDDDDDDDDEEVDCIEDVEDLDLDNNGKYYEYDKHYEEDEHELVHDLKPSDSRLVQRRRTLLLSCTAEQAALTAQDQLTSSVRRLVIELKDDSDRLSKPLAQSHGVRRKSLGATPERKRAGSCPIPYDMASGDLSSLCGDLPMPPPPPPISPPLASDDSYSDKKHHKKSAFSRIGPRVLKTLHLRKKRKTYLFTDQELETIEGARWKIVELAFRFGGKHRAYLVQAINMFFPLLKYGRRGGGHATRLHCNLCGTLQWQHKRGGLSEAVDLAGVLQVLEGRQTAVFLKYPSSSTLEECSFSVVFLGRTLDLETQSPSHRDWLVSALRTLVSYARRQRRIEQQAIAERTILPLDDDVPLVTSRARASSSRTARAHRRREDSTKMAALSPNYKIRTVY